MEFDSSPSVSYEGFGPPSYEELFNRIYLRRPDILERLRRADMPGEGVTFKDPREYSLGRRTFRPIEFQHPDKGEDRIFTGNICGFPTILVADGVTGSGSGDGREAAEEATITTIETMADMLRPGLNTLEIYSMLETAYKNSSANMKEKKMSGASTLLIGFLYEHKQEDKPPRRMWYYAYKGNGGIAIISPNRKIRGIPCDTFLVTPQEVGETAAVWAEDDSIAPVIGSVTYTKNDILYVHSDGMSPMSGWGGNNWLIKHKSIANLQTVIYLQLKDGLYGKGGTGVVKPDREIADTIKDYPFGDDAVLGIIGTEMK